MGYQIDLLTNEIVEVSDAPLGPDPVPASVSPMQIRYALTALGVMDQVNAYVEAAGPAASIAWEYATEVRRDSPMILAAAAALGMDEAAADELFRNAAKIVV